MAELTVTVPDGVGLHARPAAVFVQAAARAPADVTVGRLGGEHVNARSILAVLALDVRGGEQIVLRADGDGADEALAAAEKAILDPDAAHG
ncbi:MAG TPA: HPr family phosphocarrier protein [Actinomycetes bacterium]|jgi:phosphocarrier protein HPr|nr:HPr family phosphocarrier protein [Actinomycetes bacterium]